MSHTKSKTFKNKNHQNLYIGIIISAIIGLIILVVVSAGGNYLSLNTENSTLTGPATIKSDSLASGQSFVEFGQSTTQTNTIIVDTNNAGASDNNAGTETKPLKTIKKAVTIATAGSTIYVKAGSYSEGKIIIGKSGTSSKPIIISAFPGDKHKAIINGEGFETNGVSYIEIRDFKVQNISGVGIKIRGPIDNTAPPAVGITVDGNWTFDTCSSGISVWGVEWTKDPGDYNNVRDVKIQNNRVELANHKCFNEFITVANGVVNVEVSHNTIHNGNIAFDEGDEGIDFKEGVDNGKIHHNTFYDMADTAIYIDGGRCKASNYCAQRSFVKNIDIYANYIQDSPKSGIAIVTEGPSDVRNINVFNNIVKDTIRDGLQIYDHPYGANGLGTIDGVKFINNTVSNSGYGGPGWGGIAINHASVKNVIIRNNIAWNNPGFDLKIFHTSSGVIQSYNLCRESICAIKSNPIFSDNFKLQASSPAVNTGSSNGAPATDYADAPRPQSGGYDIGAYER